MGSTATVLKDNDCHNSINLKIQKQVNEKRETIDVHIKRVSDREGERKKKHTEKKCVILALHKENNQDHLLLL